MNYQSCNVLYFYVHLMFLQYFIVSLHEQCSSKDKMFFIACINGR